jgi:hypothetical protein
MVSVFDMSAVCCCTAPSPAQQSQEPDYKTYTNVAEAFAKKLPPSQPAQRSQEPDYSQYTNVAAKKSPPSQPQPGLGITNLTMILKARGLRERKGRGSWREGWRGRGSRKENWNGMRSEAQADKRARVALTLTHAL